MTTYGPTTVSCKKQLQKDRQKDRYLYKSYGMSLVEYKRRCVQQKNKCERCGVDPSPKPLCVDHRHVPGYKKLSPEEKLKEVRGLLCRMCNWMLGRIERFKDSRKRLQQTIIYFSKYKMKGDE